jgi:hypothetical protein
VSDRLDASLFTYGESCNFWLRMRAGKRGVSVYKPKVNGEGGDYGSNGLLGAGGTRGA